VEIDHSDNEQNEENEEEDEEDEEDDQENYVPSPPNRVSIIYLTCAILVITDPLIACPPNFTPESPDQTVQLPVKQRKRKRQHQDEDNLDEKFDPEYIMALADEADIKLVDEFVRRIEELA
jgi:hypothetical protein